MKTPGSSSAAGLNIACTCKIQLFRDEDSIAVSFQKQVTGEWLLDYVCNELNLIEKYYFGLRYTDRHARRQWLDLKKPVLKQVKDPVRESICFRVRYYPTSPQLLHEAITSYHLYMQLRRDAFHGRLVPRPGDIPVLTALILQSELGDHDDLELDEGFIKDVDLLPKQAASMEAAVVEAYKELSGLTPAQTEARFIDRVKSLDTYGIDPQPVKEKLGGETLHIGANHAGVSVFQAFRRINLVQWDSTIKCNITGKYVNLTTDISEPGQKEHKVTQKFKCSDEPSAKFLWANIVDQQYFFTLHSSERVKTVKSGGLFNRSSSFRFSGRCYDEVVSSSSKILRMGPDFVRASSSSLNRSLSIRTSQRHLSIPGNRHSVGAAPLSKSLPVSTVAADTLLDSADSSAAHQTEEEAADISLSAANESPQLSPPVDPPLTSPFGDVQGDHLVLPQTMSGSADSVEADDGKLKAADVDDPGTSVYLSVGQETLPTTPGRIAGAVHNAPLFTSTPMGKESDVTSSAASTDTPAADILVSRGEKTTDYVCQSEDGAPPTGAPPTIVITVDNIDELVSDSVERVERVEREEDFSTAAGVVDRTIKEKSDCTKGQGDGLEGKYHGDSVTANGAFSCQHPNLVQKHDPLNSDVMPGDGVGMIVPPPVPPPVHSEYEATSDPLSDSARGKLKLNLDQLEEDSDSDSSVESSVDIQLGPRKPSLARSLLVGSLLVACLLLVVFACLAYILFESDLQSVQLSEIRQSEFVSYLGHVYYKPLRNKLLSSWGDHM